MTAADMERRRARFQRDPGPVRLGNLASELHRVAGHLRARRDADVGPGLARAASLMDWCGDAATERIADMQREVCRWRRVRPLEPVRSVLVFRLESMAEELLQASGLLDTGISGGSTDPQ